MYGQDFLSPDFELFALHFNLFFVHIISGE